MAVANSLIYPGLTHGDLFRVFEMLVQRTSGAEPTASHAKIAGLLFGQDVRGAYGGSPACAFDGIIRADFQASIAPYANSHEPSFVNCTGRTESVLPVI